MANNDNATQLEMDTIQGVEAPLFDNLLMIEDLYPELSLENRKPLLLIHGWNFDGEPAPPGGAYWNHFLNYMKNDKELLSNFKPYLVKYWSNAVPIFDLGAELRKKVEELGLNDRKIVIMAHSMGGLVARSYMAENQFLSGKSKGKLCGDMVDLLVTLSSPHHGSPMANGPARDAKVDFLNKTMLQILESFVFKETTYNEQNRKDLHWDNYNNLFDYTKYTSEANLWLTKLNSDTRFDAKLTCYTAAVTGVFKIPSEGNVTESYQLGAYIQKNNFGYENDGICPVRSSSFEGHKVKKLHHFTEYNHTEINTGKTDKEELFGTFKSDLMEVAPIQLLWPNDPGLFLKHARYQTIQWNAPASIAAVNIYLSTDNGITYTTVDKNIQASLKSYRWLVPSLNSDKCLIKITDANNEDEFDSSSNPFTIFYNNISNIQLATDPYLVPGKSNLLEWELEGLAKMVSLLYIDEANGVEKMIADSFPVTAGKNSFSVNIDSSWLPTNIGFIKIRLLGLDEAYGDEEFYSYSLPEILTLGEQKVAMLSPKSSPTDLWGIYGEKYEIGQNINIEWAAEGEIKNVQIFLCDDQKRVLNKIGEKTLTPALNNSGNTDWAIAPYYGDAFYLLIKGGLSADSSTVQDYSDYSFRINKTPVIKTPLPNSENVPLLPSFEMEEIADANGYEWFVQDIADSTKSWSYSATTTLFNTPNTLENELLPGHNYRLTANALLGKSPSYKIQQSFKTEEVVPADFDMLLPIDKSETEALSIDFKWTRSVGANNYQLSVNHKGKLFAEKIFTKSDSVYTLDISKTEKKQPIDWTIAAINEFGKTTQSGTFQRKNKTDIDDLSSAAPLFTSFPNPFVTNVAFTFEVPQLVAGTTITLAIYSTNGEKIVELANANFENGKHLLTWNGCNAKGVALNSGVYLAKLTTGSSTKMLRIVKK
jgi:hypothetical protein